MPTATKTRPATKPAATKGRIATKPVPYIELEHNGQVYKIDWPADDHKRPRVRVHIFPHERTRGGATFVVGEMWREVSQGRLRTAVMQQALNMGVL